MKVQKPLHSKRRIFAALSAGFVMTFASVVSAQPIPNHQGQNHQEHEGQREHTEHGGHQAHQNNQGHEGHERHKTKLVSAETLASNKAIKEVIAAVDYSSA